MKPVSQTVLWAHDLKSRGTDMVFAHILAAYSRVAGDGPSRISAEEVGSLEGAWVALDKLWTSRSATGLRGLVVACLELPPAPRAAVTLARWAISTGVPVLIVAHGRRWIPDDGGLTHIPVVSPNASPSAVERAVLFAVGPEGTSLPVATEAIDESVMSRPSWLG
ncbi:MAG: hypothetical protein U0271_32860 [Polyangiaceae bacterium]